MSIALKQLDASGITNGYVLTVIGGVVTGAAPSGGGGGWTDDGTVVRLDTVTDGVGIGIAAINAASKFEVLGDATRRDIRFTAGSSAGAGAGGSVGLTSGTSASGTPGAITFTTGTTTSVEAGRFDAGGTLYLGNGTAGSWATGPLPEYSILSYRNARNFNGAYAYSATATDSVIYDMVRGRGTAATPSAVADGDTIGLTRYGIWVTGGATGLAATVAAHVDGAVSAGPICPGRLVLSTTAQGGSAPTERLRVNNIGTTFLGNGTLTTSGFGGAGAATTSMHSYRDSTNSVRVCSFTAASATAGPYLLLERARGTAASPAVVQSGDVIGGISFQGATTSTDTRTFVDLVAEADGAVGGVNDAPGRFRILVTPDGSGTPVECLRLDNVGTLFLGNGTAVSAITGASSQWSLTSYRDSNNNVNFYTMSAVAADRAAMSLVRGRGTASAPAIVNNGDTLGTIQFIGFSGSAQTGVGASITAYVDAAPGAGPIMPGRLVFGTTASGGGAPTDRLTIDSAGVSTFAGSVRADTDGSRTLGAANVGWQALYLAEGVDTTPGDSATINRPCGRFRKDTTGTSFTLTNSLITANSIILLTLASSLGDWPTSVCSYAVVAGSGSATITFNAAPTSDADFNFLVINTD